MTSLPKRRSAKISNYGISLVYALWCIKYGPLYYISTESVQIQYYITSAKINYLPLLLLYKKNVYRKPYMERQFTVNPSCTVCTEQHYFDRKAGQRSGILVGPARLIS